MNRLKIFIIIVFLVLSKINTTSFTVKGDFSFTAQVSDSATKAPVTSARVYLLLQESIVATEVTDLTGRVVFKNIDPGRYIIKVLSVGFEPFLDSIEINDKNSNFSIALKEYSTEEIDIVAERDKNVSSVDTKSGNQIFAAELSHSSPTSRMTNIIQENVVGAVKAPSGEVHVNGQHGEFNYYIDGIPISPGVFGGLNEVVDPKVIDKAVFMTGGFPAEYGGQMAAVVDILNHVPEGKFHLDFNSYIGSYFVLNGTKPFSPGLEVPIGHSSSVPGDTLGGRVGPFRSLNSNGQSLSLSNHLNKFGFFISASRQENDRRIDQPVATLYNDNGRDYFLYGKFDYLINKTDYITANLNYSKTNTQVPFDMSTQGYSPDNQITTNTFQTISYFHRISEKKNKESNLFIGLYGRQGSLLYQPSPVSPPNFQFKGDSTLYALTEDRNFSTYGLRAKYESNLSKIFIFSTGINFSVTKGNENFTSRDSSGKPGPQIYTMVKGSDFGVFIQGGWNPLTLVNVEAGFRYDQHIAPEASLQKQFSPRIKVNFTIDNFNHAYLYYGKLFMPTNIEGLRDIASNLSTSNTSTLPERDDLFEGAYIRNFKFNLNAKLDIFYKYSSPGIDDQTIGASSVKTPVNIAIIKTTGVELALSYNHPKIPISTYLNAALIHALGQGAITGGFLNISSAGDGTDLDHDQRLSITAGINYQPKDWFVNFESIYGSGLTNGNPNNITYEKGLFDFNWGAHVSPYVIFNISGGYTFHLYNDFTIQPSLYITNLFDHAYILKGAYFSAASYGERRNVTLKLNFHI